MEWVGGTPEAIKLINELIKSGDLIDFYSKDVFDRPKIQEIIEISLDEVQKEHGKKFLNHLLIGCFHESNLHLLMNKFQPSKSYFESCYRHQHYDTRPCFAIINLIEKSVCLMNVGSRKGHYYEDYFTVSMSNLHKVKDNFEKYDYVGIVSNIRESLEEIADLMNKFAYYEDEVNDEDFEEIEFHEYFLQNIFPKFSLDWIQSTFKPF